MSIIIKDIKRNNTEIIRIEVSEFKGRHLINIRIWYASIDRASGEAVYKPTQKGVTLDIGAFDQLKEGIDKLEQYIADTAQGTQPEQLGADQPPATDEQEKSTKE